MSKRVPLIACLILPALCGKAAAQTSNIDPVNRFSFAPNLGFMNWRGSGVGGSGASIGRLRMSGFVWCENAGWLNLGRSERAGPDGTYANTDGSNTGVNIDPNTGALSGLAWGENIGWVNFDTRATLGPLGLNARVDRSARRLRGYAWSPSAGWINLDLTTQPVSIGCAADFNGDGARGVDDIFAFLSAWFANDPRSDADGNGTRDVSDIFVFLSAWFAGCA